MAREHATVRFRITAVAALAVAAVLSVTGAALVLTQRRVLTDNLDETLTSQAEAIAAEVSAGRVPSTPPPVADDDGITQVVDAGGRVLAASAGAAGIPPVAGPPPGNERAENRTVDAALAGDQPQPYRVASVRADGAAGAAVVHVAAPLDDIRDSTTVLARSLAVAVPAATALLALVVWWLVGRTLRPVEAIRREVAGIGGRALDRRVPVPAGDDEVTRLARTMNGMLDRIEDAARRQQRFVADASHELRSPLARIRAEIEVDLAHPGGADPAATSRSVLAEALGMQHLVDDLLVLARSDAGVGGGGRRAAVDLDDVVERQLRRLRDDERVAVDGTGVAAAQVTGDRDRLARAVGNVLDNARRHARTTVAVTVAELGDDAVVTVTDDGPGIPPDRADEVFERFARLDGARTVGTGGSGLGLAIAREIVVDHGGTIAIDTAHRPGARVVITLPRNGPVSPPAERPPPARPPTP